MDSYDLKSVLDLPAPFRSTFNFRYFNSLQSDCFSGCYLSDMNMVISAPTGSGKTVLFELCILRLLSRFLSQDDRFNHIKGTLKTIYIAPSKALVQEKLRHWNQKLGSWGIQCLELTGDTDSYNKRNMQEADIILTTPEKFDSVTRYHIRDGGLSFFSDIGLVLIDEVHLLNDPRGASLEAIVSRIKMLARSPQMSSSSLARVRFIAVSATIPNIEDIGEWLMVPVQGIKRFGEEMRPVKLTTRVYGYAPAKNDFLFERRLQNYVFDILMQHSRGKSALVFCSTRKGAQEAALRLSQNAMTFGRSNPFVKSIEQQERLKEASFACSDKQMQTCILFGVGYHNGGLCLKDRNLIEGLFLSGDLQILCTTNTLAHGINLPAHTVVVKSTQYFNKEKGLYMEYDRSMILQMSGRAGRPPFDDTGMVIIMTRKETVHLYENLLNGCEMVESQLLSCITEHLAAEIVQLTVSDISRAIEWIKCSYLYVRMKKNPENYALKKRIPGECLEKHTQEICVQKANELSRHGMIWTDEYGFLLKPLEPGRLMTKYYLKFDTMKNIMQTPDSCSLEDALHVVCRSEEISWIQLRRNEKKVLNDINTDKEGRLRFHVLSENGKRKKRIQSREEKIFVLANDCLTGDPLSHDLSLNQDMNSICSNGCRIAKCMKEYFVYKKNYKAALNSILLAKCLHHKLWDDSPYLLKQLTGIGTVTAKALNSAGINSFGTLAEAEPRRIEIVTGRKYPFGNHIKESLLSLPPKVEMKIEEIECRRQGKSRLSITLTRLPQSASSARHHYADMVVGSEEDNLILFHEKIRVDEFSSPYSAEVLVSCPHQGSLSVKANLIFDEYIGIDLHEKLLVAKEVDSSMIPRRGGQKALSTHDLPKEVFVVEDDEDTQAVTKQTHVSSTSMDTSMPSFNLLDEDMGEGGFIIEAEEKESENITEQTVFDHIRRKAKNFPLFPTSNNIDSSKLDIITPTRKRQEHHEPHTSNTGSEGPDKSVAQRETVVIPDAEPGDADNLKYGADNDEALKDHTLLRNSGPFNIPQKDANEGVSISEHEENIFEGVTIETIFDHIHKKSKNFPILRTTEAMKFEPLVPTRKRFCKDQIELHSIIEGTDFPGEMEHHLYGTNGGANVKQHISFDNSSGRTGKPFNASEVAVHQAGLTETVMASSGISLVKEDILPHRGRNASPLTSSGVYNGKLSPYSFESNKRLCSTDAVVESGKAASFHGFKSVFSFL